MIMDKENSKNKMAQMPVNKLMLNMEWEMQLRLLFHLITVWEAKRGWQTA